MYASQLQDLIVSTLVRKHGGSTRRWRIALGPLKVHDRVTHPTINWSVEPHGAGRENAIIEGLLDDLRLAHPLVEDS